MLAYLYTIDPPSNVDNSEFFKKVAFYNDFYYSSFYDRDTLESSSIELVKLFSFDSSGPEMIESIVSYLLNYK